MGKGSTCKRGSTALLVAVEKAVIHRSGDHMDGEIASFGPNAATSEVEPPVTRARP